MPTAEVKQLAGAGISGIAALLPLFRELNDLKRIKSAARRGSIAQRIFIRSWFSLATGEILNDVVFRETAHAVASTRLAGIDAQVLINGGLTSGERLSVFRDAFDVVSKGVPSDFANMLRAGLSADPLPSATYEGTPDFASSLHLQPRAGATRPGYARVVLEPTENHAEHCAIVAINAALAAPLFGADPAQAFLTGLSHHFHNAYFPDAGDAGDALLGEHLRPIMETFRNRAIEQLPKELGEAARASLNSVFRSDTPESKAFQTADSLDRVLEMEWHARSASFTLSVALDEMDIIHPGPVQAFQQEVMRAAGFFPVAKADTN